jgi:hypothetical protein
MTGRGNYVHAVTFEALPYEVYRVGGVKLIHGLADYQAFLDAPVDLAGRNARFVTLTRNKLDAIIRGEGVVKSLSKLRPWFEAFREAPKL